MRTAERLHETLVQGEDLEAELERLASVEIFGR